MALQGPPSSPTRGIYQKLSLLVLHAIWFNMLQTGRLSPSSCSCSHRMDIYPSKKSAPQFSVYAATQRFKRWNHWSAEKNWFHRPIYQVLQWSFDTHITVRKCNICIAAILPANRILKLINLTCYFFSVLSLLSVSAVQTMDQCPSSRSCARDSFLPN